MKDKVATIDEMFREVGGIEHFINQGFSISTRLSDHGIREPELTGFAAKTIKKSDVQITPAMITESDLLDIYMNTL